MIGKIGFVPLLFGVVAWGAVSGTVRNGTTGQPQPGVEVTFYRFGQGGMEPVDHVKTDAQGNFSFNQEASGQGPTIVRAERDGVTYNHLMPPGSPTTGFTMTVYDASKQPGPAKVSKHMLLFQPANGQMVVNETFIIENPGKSTWFNPAGGTVQFYLPKGANGNVDVKGTAPDGSGMAVPVPSGKVGKDTYSAKFEIKPGETRLDLSYSVPYTEGQSYEGTIPTKDDNSYLIVPNGVTLAGDHLKDLGTEPRTQAHIYGLMADSYKIQLTGTEAAAPAADTSADQSDNSGPGIEQIMPRIYAKAKLILALALGILALGFALLYRANPEGVAPKESNERGRH